MKERLRSMWTPEKRQEGSEKLKAKNIRNWTEESRRKCSESHKGMIPWLKGKHHTEKAKKLLSKSRLFVVVPSKDTSIEIKIQKELTQRGLCYVKHYPVKGQPDIAFPDQKIAIFLDGDYWHSLEKAKKHDPEVNAFLKEQGWNVLRYTEKLIKSNSQAIVDEIENELSLALATIPIC
jgi:DNA mismatch endonuclease (patch repair protein)